MSIIMKWFYCGFSYKTNWKNNYCMFINDSINKGVKK